MYTSNAIYNVTINLLLLFNFLYSLSLYESARVVIVNSYIEFEIHLGIHIRQAVLMMIPT